MSQFLFKIFFHLKQAITKCPKTVNFKATTSPVVHSDMLCLELQRCFKVFSKLEQDFCFPKIIDDYF